MSFELERERVVQELCHHFAQDRLTTEELDSRLEAAYRAADADQLRALLAGLPASVPVVASRADRAPVAPHAMAPAPERRLLSVFGSVKKRGEWEPGHSLRAVAVFAEMELDFRDARLGPGITTVNVSSTFAEVRIIVPPGLHVECDGTAVLGEFSTKMFGFADPDAGAPTLRIVGQAVFGEVSVKMAMRK